MQFQFAISPATYVVTDLGDKAPLPGHPGFVSHKSCTLQNGHKSSIFTKESEAIAIGQGTFIEATVDGIHKVLVSMPAFHALKGSAAPDKPAQDAKYTGGQPAQQQAAEKPKDYPWATETLPAGEHHKKILILDIKPAINKDGVRMTNEYQGKVAYKFNVTFALDGVKRTAIIDSSSEIDPMIPQSGEVDIIIKVTPAQREGGKPFYALKKPKSGGGGFGGGSAPADPALVLLAGIVSNPSIDSDQWELKLLKAINTLNAVKSSLSKLVGGSK